MKSRFIKQRTEQKKRFLYLVSLQMENGLNHQETFPFIKPCFIRNIWKDGSLSTVVSTSVMYVQILFFLVHIHQMRIQTLQTCKMECLAKRVNGFQPLTILAKRSILHVWKVLNKLLFIFVFIFRVLLDIWHGAIWENI